MKLLGQVQLEVLAAQVRTLLWLLGQVQHEVLAAQVRTLL